METKLPGPGHRCTGRRRDLFLNAFATTAVARPSIVVMSGLHNHANGQYGTSTPSTSSRVNRRIGLSSPGHVECGLPDRTHWKIPRRSGRSLPLRDLPPRKLRNAVQMAEQSREFITEESEKPFFCISRPPTASGGGKDKTSHADLKPDLFGNKPNRKSHEGVEEVFYDPKKYRFLLPSGYPETREELATTTERFPDRPGGRPIGQILRKLISTTKR